MNVSNHVSKCQVKVLISFYEIGHYLTHDTTASGPISPKERLEICLYGLSFCDYYQTTAETTGNRLTTVQCITHEVCTKIVSKLWSEFVNVLEIVDQILTAISQTEDKWQFPSALGGVHDGHNPMKRPCNEN